ncbi:MAG: pilus assembly protein [Deltaproteobacteria bacterium]|nr:pilus assembly protein [Deltaproteobacteria bacterium]
MKKMRGRVGNERGTYVVEFALILPLFFMLILGIIDFGRYFFAQHTLQFATREGTRLALVGRTLIDPGTGNALSREASIVWTIRDNADSALDLSRLSINIYPVQSNFSDPQGWEGQLNAGAPGDYMRVRSQYTFEFLTPMIGNFFSPSGTTGMRAEATYRNELFE